MTPLTSYKSQSRPAVLIIGPPGTAKTTTVVGAFPNVMIVEIDNNIAGTLKFLTDEKVDFSSGQMTIPHLDPTTNALIPRRDRWRTMTKQIKDAIDKDNTESKGVFADMKIKTIFIDSLTGLIEYALDEVRRQQGRKIGSDEKDVSSKTELDKDEPLQIQDWGCFGALLRHFFINLRASQRIFVLSAHTFTDKDELQGFMKLFINCPGKFKEEIAGLFTECWKMSIEKKDDKYLRMITSVPVTVVDSSLGLKSALRLGNKFEVNYEKIRTALLS